jgi:CubicO group peptidase (beta-lactamase class C family)
MAHYPFGRFRDQTGQKRSKKAQFGITTQYYQHIKPLLTLYPKSSINMNLVRLGLLVISLLGKVAVNAQSLPEVADSLRRNAGIPELGFAVVSAEGVKTINVCGHHRNGQKGAEDTASLQDYFHLGSNTKAITSFVAAYMVGKHQIEWSTRFFELFPEWKAKSNKHYDEITLQDLLSHRAGIQPYTNGGEYTKLPKFTGTLSQQRKQFAAFLLKQSPAVDAAMPYVYSNAGYSIAALMLEQASGKTWEALVEEVLSKELGLKYKLGWPNRSDIHQPWGHWQSGLSLEALPPDATYDLKLAEPAGDISMTLPDYAKFIQLHLQGLKGQNNLLAAGAYEFMHYGVKAYAMGWGNINNDTAHISEHAGSAGTFFCYTQIDKDKGLAYIVVANSATPPAQKAIFSMVKKLKAVYKQ